MRRATAGMTLIEMMMVVTIISLIAAITFPAVTSGLDSIRLTSASDSVVSFLNAGLNRAQRRQVPVEIVVSVAENKLKMFTVDATRELAIPETVKIARIHPPLISGEEEQQRSIVLYPNGAIPRFGIELVNQRDAHRIVRVDPITGVPEVENLQ